jgi:hypothetical protein
VVTLNILDRALIEKTAGENGWENVVGSGSTEVIVGSARHPAQARILPSDIPVAKWCVELSGKLLQLEVARSFPEIIRHDSSFHLHGYEPLARLLYRAAELAMSLPNQAAVTFAQKVEQELAGIYSFTTEVERLVKQRVGQNTFRQALLDYWGGACAVTGISLPEALRASHAKPWADCSNDQERLNVFNGFLLTANLDALFDRGLITFDDDGSLICSGLLNEEQRFAFQLHDDLQLRWITPHHAPFLLWHRNKVFE